MADTYLKLHDGFPENRKVVAAGGDAAWLHVCALAYASRNLTDGLIPEGVVSRLSDRKQPTKLAAKLIEVGLWHKAGHDCPRCPQPGAGEYLIHDYLEHQRSAAKVEEIKGKRAVAGSKGGTRKAANAKGHPKQTPSNLLGGSHGSAEAKATPDTDTEEVLRTSRTEADVPPSAGAAAPQAGDPVTSQTIIGEWLDRCQNRPPNRVIGQLSKEIKGLLDEGINPDHVRRGVAEWMTRNAHPSTLASFVNGVMNANGVRQLRPTGTDGHGPTSGPRAAGPISEEDIW
ncbi:hypothetical protein N5079_19640 [Planotetraspora sp. A-T 1434]|uniref:hypothetical protein n=1 Tax=Planotetraspora sp. A-T 1434 TaxID=2979219 RepID=UPI0021C078A9|nr:hypothetical protein [Planotetraspora sp. A-T 1434]MCT9932417.1 hypothetical protein [Planotetraspora sp. A-T 1434]